MSYDAAFDEFLNLIVTLTPQVGRDGWGAATGPGAPRQVQARVEHDMKLVRDESGREVPSQTVVFMKPTDTTGASYTIAKTDKLTLPAAFVPQEPPIISVKPHYDESGQVHHFEVRT